MSPSSFPASVTQPDVQSDVPTNANEHCVGTESDQAYVLQRESTLLMRLEVLQTVVMDVQISLFALVFLKALTRTFPFFKLGYRP
jgi:hypothetical protein